MRGLRIVLGLTLLLAACTGAAAASAKGRLALRPRAAAVTTRADVFVVGDSISHGAGDQIDATFARRGWAVDRVSMNGKTVADMRLYIARAARNTPDAVVIELGSNDMGGVALADPGQTTAPTASEQVARYRNALAQLRHALADLRNVPCVVWVDVNNWTDLNFGPLGHYDLITWGPVYDAQLRREAATHSNLHIASYRAQIAAKGLPWLADNFDDWKLHPDTVAAKQAVADIMARGVQQACGL
jgi:lysophospholipase L1-like esterase